MNAGRLQAAERARSGRAEILADRSASYWALLAKGTTTYFF